MYPTLDLSGFRHRLKFRVSRILGNVEQLENMQTMFDLAPYLGAMSLNETWVALSLNCRTNIGHRAAVINIENNEMTVVEPPGRSAQAIGVTNDGLFVGHTRGNDIASVEHERPFVFSPYDPMVDMLQPPVTGNEMDGAFGDAPGHKAYTPTAIFPDGTILGSTEQPVDPDFDGDSPSELAFGRDPDGIFPSLPLLRNARRYLAPAAKGKVARPTCIWQRGSISKHYRLRFLPEQTWNRHFLPWGDDELLWSSDRKNQFGDIRFGVFDGEQSQTLGFSLYGANVRLFRSLPNHSFFGSFSVVQESRARLSELLCLTPTELWFEGGNKDIQTCNFVARDKYAHPLPLLRRSVALGFRQSSQNGRFIICQARHEDAPNDCALLEDTGEGYAARLLETDNWRILSCFPLEDGRIVASALCDGNRSQFFGYTLPVLLERA